MTVAFTHSVCPSPDIPPTSSQLPQWGGGEEKEGEEGKRGWQLSKVSPVRAAGVACGSWQSVSSPPCTKQTYLQTKVITSQPQGRSDDLLESTNGCRDNGLAC